VLMNLVVHQEVVAQPAAPASSGSPDQAREGTPVVNATKPESPAGPEQGATAAADVTRAAPQAVVAANANASATSTTAGPEAPAVSGPPKCVLLPHLAHGRNSNQVGPARIC
jgi:hypothetical protein